MEENNSGEITGFQEEKGCINCGDLSVVKGYPNALCQNCRENLVKFQIPLWVKLFAASIGLIFLFSLYKIPGHLVMGIHVEKGRTAMEQKKYLTAQKEFQQVAEKMPDYIEAQGNLLIAAFHNLDFATLNKSYEKLKDKEIEDKDLFSQIETVLQKSESYFGDEAFNKIQQEYEDDYNKIPDSVLRRFSVNNNTFAAMVYASRLFDKNDFAASDSITKKIIDNEPDFIPAYMTLASSKRMQNQYDESFKYCDKILSINSEYVEAISSKSRTLLKAKRDTEALNTALIGFHLDEKNSYAIGSLILAYHFNKKQKEEKELMKNISSLNDSTSIQTLRYVVDVINGKEFFRN